MNKPSADESPHYVGLAAEARRLGVSTEFLRRAAAAGKIRAFRLGNKWLLLKGTADALVQPQ